MEKRKDEMRFNRKLCRRRLNDDLTPNASHLGDQTRAILDWHMFNDSIADDQTNRAVRKREPFAIVESDRNVGGRALGKPCLAGIDIVYFDTVVQNSL